MMGDSKKFYKFLIIASMYHIFFKLRQTFSSFSSRLVFFAMVSLPLANVNQMRSDNEQSVKAWLIDDFISTGTATTDGR